MTWRPVAHEEDITAGNMKSFVIEDEPVTIYRLDDSWFATSDICTHQQCSLSEGEIDGDEVICECHGGAFDIRSGKATRMPCAIPVQTYPVRLSAGVIEVDFD